MKRPVLVTIIGVLAILGGIAQAAFGGVLMTLRNDAQFLADSKMTTDKVTYLAVGCMVVGVLTVLFAVGLLKGNRVSRDLIGLMEVAAAGCRHLHRRRRSTPHTARQPSATSPVR